MRLYVMCKKHPQEKIYLSFTGEQPQSRGQINLPIFSVECPSTRRFYNYARDEVVAEEGAALPLTGAALGALLFLINPISGMIGTLVGAAGGRASEVDKVKRFNESRAK